MKKYSLEKVSNLPKGHTAVAQLGFKPRYTESKGRVPSHIFWTHQEKILVLMNGLCALGRR